MNVLLSVLIIAAAPDAPTEGRFPGAAELFRCTFAESADRDFDGWPDGWTRQQGPGFPHYVKVLISPDPTPAGDRSLRIDLDGGAAAAYTPPVAVEPSRDYVVEGLVDTEGLQRDRVCLSLTFLDQAGQPVETFTSEKVGRQTGWHRLRLGPVSPKSEVVRRAAIGVHVEPGDGADLQGVARFGDLWLGQLPRVTLSTGNATGLFAEGQPMTITCDVCGMASADGQVRFELLDESGSRLTAADVPLQTPGGSSLRGVPASGILLRSAGMTAAQWQPRPPGVGFYRVRATASGRQLDRPAGNTEAASQDSGAAPATVVCREITLAVLQPEPIPAESEFGWSVSRDGSPLPAPLLAELAARAGIRWVKYPLAEDPKTGSAGTSPLADVLQQFSRQGIHVVGVIEPPANPPGTGRGEATTPSIAEWLGRDRKVWAPVVEAAATRSGGRIAWWQLGGDGDRSFVGCRDLAARLDPVKAAIEQAGQVANLALSDAGPLGSRRQEPWFSAAARSTPARWVSLQALFQDRYPPQDRAADLARQMIAAKAQGAGAVFLADPLDAERGLFEADRRPGDLFMPWRTVALLLGGAKFAGQVALPEASVAQVFLRGRDAVVAVWNPRPGRETVGWGQGVRRVDLWGRQTPLATGASTSGGLSQFSCDENGTVPSPNAPSASDPLPASGAGQTIDVGPVPAFLVGIDPKVAQWQLGVALARDHVPGPLSPRQANGLTWRNTLDQEVQGTVTLTGPKGWTIEPRQIAFRLSGGESIQKGLTAVAAIDAVSGRQVVRADFELRTSPIRRFSTWLPVRVGPEDVRLQIDMGLSARGELEVRQRLANDTDLPIRFRCRLFVPDRRVLTAMVTSSPHGVSIETYPVARGAELLGKALWLQAEEIDGPRVLNCRCVVGE